MKDDRDQTGDSFLDQLSEIVNNGRNVERELTESDSSNIFLNSILDFGGESEERRSSFDRVEDKAVPSNTFDQESIFFGLDGLEGKPGPPSSDMFLDSLINLLVENTNIEEDFSGHLGNAFGDHSNGGRAVIELREEDYPDIFDTADTAGNVGEILDNIAVDSALALGPVFLEQVVREKTFIEEEEESNQHDVEETANQLAGLLSDLEGSRSKFFFPFYHVETFAADRLEEARLKETVLSTIRFATKMYLLPRVQHMAKITMDAPQIARSVDGNCAIVQASLYVLRLREAIVRKNFFLRSLHKMEIPLAPFMKSVYFFVRPFCRENKDDFEGCLERNIATGETS